MSLGLLALFVVVGLGNYLMRCLPLLISLRHREERPPDAADGAGAPDDRPFSLVGPCVVVALLVTSLLPQGDEPPFGARMALDLVALVPTVLVAWRTRNLGLTVLVGVLAYWSISSVLPGVP
jgi:branched-subunit amino acid transport protein